MSCIRTGFARDTKALCGKDTALVFAFVDAGHWLCSALTGSRLAACPDCLRRLEAAVREQLGES